jgi:hypothetical protein
MRGNKIAAAACVGLAIAVFAPIKASAQNESELYHDRWAKPFCMQPAWDEKKWEQQTMRWDIKNDDRATDMSKTSESVVWHDRWSKGFDMQPYWDEARWENHNMRWDVKDVGRAEDLSDTPESVVWHDRWSKPFCMQPYWDEARWEEHCLNRDQPMHYRHNEAKDMEYRSE